MTIQVLLHEKGAIPCILSSTRQRTVNLGNLERTLHSE